MEESDKKRKDRDYNDLPDGKRKKQTSELKLSASSPDLLQSINESCPICLSPTRKKFIGLPKNCEHHFCLQCLKKWSKRKNTCPVCRKKYGAIIVKSRYTRRRIKQLPIKKYADPEENSRYTTAFMTILSRVFVNFVGNLFVVVHG